MLLKDGAEGGLVVVELLEPKVSNGTGEEHEPLPAIGTPLASMQPKPVGSNPPIGSPTAYE